MERINMLSIIVLFCDKDMWHIPGLVEYIKETCKGDYEVVLVDNRKEKNTPPPDTGWPVYEAPGIGTFEGRRFALSKCRGKYVWFIDADDKILDWSGFINPDEQDADFIFFNASELRDKRCSPVYDDNVPTVLIQTGKELHKNIRLEVSQESFRHIYLPLWNKFIRLDFARKVYDMVTPLPSVTDHEDSLMSAMLLKHAEYVSDWTDKTIYIYDSRNSTSSVGITPNIERYKRLNRGQQKLLEFARGHFTDAEWKRLGFDLYFYGDYYWRFRFLPSLPDKIEAIKFLAEEFSHENLLGIMKYAEQCDEFKYRRLMEKYLIRYCLPKVRY